MILIKKLVESLKSEFPEIREENFQLKSEFGDVSTNICFIEGRKRKIDPAKLATKVAKKIKLPREFEKVEAKNGYLNFYFDYKKIANKILKQKIKKARLRERIMVEFSTPNPCKAMHLGHARTTFLGDSISRILEFLGYEVIKANYYNDLGKQVAKEIIAFEKYGLKNKKKIDHELAEIYARLHKEEKQEEIDEKAQEILRDLENKGKKYRSKWKKIIKFAIKGFNETYKKLGISFDVVFFESDFRKRGKEIARLLLKKKICFEDDGAIVANLEKYHLPKTVILKRDGTGLYITSDLALTIHKFEKFKLAKAIWVVGSDQKTYFKQLFKILELYGFKKNCIHMDYNLVNLKGKKMSSRAGKFILLDDLVDELIESAKKEVKKRGERNERKIREIAEKIALGALKYEILKVERNKVIDFDPGRAISFEGNTGPYLQYMVVRCNSILKKVGENKSRDGELKEINEFEKVLLKNFLEFPIVIEKSGEQLKPNLVCNYAYELATNFSKFYENCRVIGSENEEFRLNLVKKTKEILEICLNLLGIEIPEKM